MPNTLFITSILLFVVAVAGFWVTFSLFCTIFHDAPFVPLKRRDVERLKNLMPIKQKSVVYDLGSGNGNNLIFMAETFDTQGVGIEKSSFLYCFSRFRIWRKKLQKKVTIHRGNFFHYDLSGADYVLCYLFPAVMQKLAGKFQRELKPGAVIISFSFPIHSFQAFKVDKPTGRDKAVYIYKMKQLY